VAFRGVMPATTRPAGFLHDCRCIQTILRGSCGQATAPGAARLLSSFGAGKLHVLLSGRKATTRLSPYRPPAP
jgi:hypothetical protein